MHYQFEGSEAAYELVTQYCRQSDRFDELGQREKWDSITHETDNPATMASLIAIANEARRERERKEILNLLNDDSDEQGSAVDFYPELQRKEWRTARQPGERHDVPQSGSRACQHRILRPHASCADAATSHSRDERGRAFSRDR